MEQRLDQLVVQRLRRAFAWVPRAKPRATAQWPATPGEDRPLA